MNMKYMYKQKSFSMVGVLMATVIFLLVSSVIVENMVFLIQTNNYKKYFLVGNYLANEGIETTKAILNRNIEQELASNTIDNPGEYTNAKLRWQIYWDQGISPKDSFNSTTEPGNNEYKTYRFDLSTTNTSIIEGGFILVEYGTAGDFESTNPDTYRNNSSSSDYQLNPPNIGDEGNGYNQGADYKGFTIYRQVDIIGRDNDDGDPAIYDEVTNATDYNSIPLTGTYYSPEAIEVLSTVTLVDNKGRKYLYQVKEKIPRPNLYN